jgi:hypothetical protein
VPTSAGKLDGCSHWHLIGLAWQTDDAQVDPFLANLEVSSSHVVLSRLTFRGNTVQQPTTQLLISHSSDVLVEYSALYAVAAGALRASYAHGVTSRRNYVHREGMVERASWLVSGCRSGLRRPNPYYGVEQQ